MGLLVYSLHIACIACTLGYLHLVSVVFGTAIPIVYIPLRSTGAGTAGTVTVELILTLIIIHNVLTAHE